MQVQITRIFHRCPLLAHKEISAKLPANFKNLCYLTWQPFQTLLPCDLKGDFPYPSIINRPMNHMFCFKVWVQDLKISAIDSAHSVSLLKCYPTIVSLLPFSFFSIYLLTRWFTSCYMFHSRPHLSQCNISYNCKQRTLPGKYSFGLLCYETCWGVLICILLVLAWLTPMSLRCETVNFFWRRKLNIHFCVNYLYSN